VGRTDIAQGDYLCMLYASGYRGEALFGEIAAQFNIKRPTNPIPVLCHHGHG